MPPTPQDPQEAKGTLMSMKLDKPNTPTTPPPEVAKEVAPEPQKPKDPFDLSSILLPKKETPGQTPQSAQRINAGALLEQEQHATLLTPDAEVAKAPPAAAVPAEPPKEETAVKAIETYQRAIEHVVKDTNVSMLTIATAEAERRSRAGSESQTITLTTPSATLLKTIGLYALGFLLLAGASGALAYIMQRPTSVQVQQAAATPFITVDSTKDITILPSTTRDGLLPSLTAAKNATALSLGLMARLLITVPSSTEAGPVLTPINAQSFFNLVAPNMSADLLRTIRPTYLLGVHVYDNNQPFLLMSVDSYGQAYAGMVAWEPYMHNDLLPLFAYTPRVHIPEEGIATSTIDPNSQFIQTGFVDSIVENHDARVIKNESGDITFLWTFLDRNTLVITTNAATVREIISRLKNAPITSVPTQ